MISFNDASSLNVVDTVEAKNEFVRLFKTNWGKSDEEANSFYLAERIAFKTALKDEKIAKCTKDSIFSSFLTVAIKGLSIQDKYYAYLEASSRKTSDNQYESVCVFKITVKGEITERIRAGFIKYVTDPVIVYEGDTIDILDKGAGLTVDYKMAIPRKSQNIIMCYVYIVMPNNDKRLSYMDQLRIEELKGYSLKKNKTSANALYTSNNGQIDTGMLKTKTIKFALKDICKDSLKATEKDINVSYESEDEEDDVETTNIPDPVDRTTNKDNEELPF